MKINTIIYLVLAEQTQLDCSGAPPPLYFRCIFSGGPSLVIAPAGLPSEVEDKLHKAAIKTLRSAELKKQSADPGNPRRNIEGESPLHGKDTRSEVLPKRVRVVSDHRPGPMLWCAPIVFGANSEQDRCAHFRLIGLCARVCPRESPFGGKKAGGSDHAPDGIAARSGASAIPRDRCRYAFGNVICADTDALQAWPPFNGW